MNNILKLTPSAVGEIRPEQKNRTFIKNFEMAKNKPVDNARIGAVKNRSQTFNPKTGLWVKRNSQTGLLMEVKETGGVFKGVRKEGLRKMATTLNKLAKYDKG